MPNVLWFLLLRFKVRSLYPDIFGFSPVARTNVNISRHLKKTKNLINRYERNVAALV